MSTTPSQQARAINMLLFFLTDSKHVSWPGITFFINTILGSLDPSNHFEGSNILIKHIALLKSNSIDSLERQGVVGRPQKPPHRVFLKTSMTIAQPSCNCKSNLLEMHFGHIPLSYILKQLQVLAQDLNLLLYFVVKVKYCIRLHRKPANGGVYYRRMT